MFVCTEISMNLNEYNPTW